MRVLGIDPGTVHLGYGVIDADGSGIKMVGCGSVSFPKSKAVEKRLVGLYLGLLEIIDTYRPDEVAVEEPFVHENVRTALAIGRAESVALLAAASKELPVFRYPPAVVKQRVTGAGAAGKRRVQQLVRLMLGLTAPPETSDASDALAVAICHFREQRCRQLVGGARLERVKLSRRKIAERIVKRQQLVEID